MKTLIKPCKGLKPTGYFVFNGGLLCENANKTLQGIKTKMDILIYGPPYTRENANKTLQGIKT